MLAQIQDPQASLHALEQRLLSMPPVRALALNITHYDGRLLRLSAPLGANINDKGSAFGGSLASLMTLAAYSLTMLKLNEAGHTPDVYVQDSQLRYLKPLYDELRIEAQLAPGEEWISFIAAYAARGRARTHLVARTCDADGTAVTCFEGRFVALRPDAC